MTDKDDKDEKKSKKGGEGAGDVLGSEALLHAAKILERMVNLNTYDEIAQDFKFWDDASDMFREGEGTLLPLWKFAFEGAAGKHVTAVKWNHKFSDLFAVGFGSFDFLKQSSGLICIYSLKNPSHPERHWSTMSGAMSLDWHKDHASLLCVGLYDGSICVYDTRSPETKPLFLSNATTGKHTDPVWEVSWQMEDMVNDLSFFSVSSDGRITFWSMSKSSGLEFTD